MNWKCSITGFFPCMQNLQYPPPPPQIQCGIYLPPPPQHFSNEHSLNIIQTIALFYI